MGKPNLKDDDKKNVEQANILIVWVASMVAFLGKLNIAGSLENPRGSRLFFCPCIQQAKHKVNARMVSTVFCAFGTAWCKPTTFMYWCWSALGRIGRRCLVKHNKCEHSARPHQVLEGKGPGGVSWTAIACPYPKQLCAEYAIAAKVHFQSRFIRKLEQR